MTKEKQNIDKSRHDEPLEQWLRQALPGDQPPARLQEKLLKIPDQFPRPELHQTPAKTEPGGHWLFPALATAVSVMGIMVGTLGGIPEQNLLVALLYGSPGLGVAL